MQPTLHCAESHVERITAAPLVTAAMVQAGGCVAAYGTAWVYAFEPGLAWLALAGVLAASAGWILNLPWWWTPINLALPPAAGLLLTAPVPASAYLAAFAVLWLGNAAAWRNRVPLYLSSAAAIEALVTLLPGRRGFQFCDLGCGTGSVIAALAAARPDGHYHGIEMSPLTFGLSWLRTRVTGKSAVVQCRDFWDLDLERFDVVYAYLSPAAMLRLWQKARREMRPGALLVSNSFDIPGVPPLFSVPCVGRDTLYVWRL